MIISAAAYAGFGGHFCLVLILMFIPFYLYTGCQLADRWRCLYPPFFPPFSFFFFAAISLFFNKKHQKEEKKEGQEQL